MKPQSVEHWLAQLGQPNADRDYKPGHERMLDLLKPLTCQQPKLRIRIAGTNGKGSTAFMLAAGLQAAGLKVGLYTSPHVLNFNERIRINGAPISDQALLTLLTAIMPIALDVGASYFEMATALALQHFSQTKVDVEILEAGVGARLDATTAVAADMALITPIGLDHEAWLGNSILEVAQEKSYALKGCKWALSAPQSAEVQSILELQHQQLHYSHPIQQDCAMPGAHQKINAGLASTALETLRLAGKIHATPQKLMHAMCTAVAPGRLQYIAHHQAHIWLDAAHNRHAVEALLPSLTRLADPFDAILIYTRQDRSLVDCYELLRPYTRQLISNVTYPSPTQALEALLQAQPKAHILLLGSFLSVAEALHYLARIIHESQ